MKFKFCSDGDCPQWALAGLHALGSLPAPLFRTLVQYIADQKPADDVKVLLQDTSLSSRDEVARASIVIRWVLQQAFSCSCSGAQLTRDLLVLGVPRTHALAFAEALENYTPDHILNYDDNGTLVKMTDVAAGPGPNGTYDTVTISVESEPLVGEVQEKRELVLMRSDVLRLKQDLTVILEKIRNIRN